ncbi:Divergent polysaccharide deacetylase [Desulfonema limicola]|uniref:Divergent polysaccharide deacetylase n=1 Tax=Desulfonema limicola TaxID=45656 RepID=A0A975BC27_9BACT|nr:divergent polysaccharide deacetylase family protein [Desulfonema limicola]QTA82672.1 Divergent polysaccharide deacetylase [Desulfonema limicola]
MITPEHNNKKINSPYSSAAIAAGLLFTVLLFTVHCPGKSSTAPDLFHKDPNGEYNQAYEIPVYEVYPYGEDDIIKDIPVSERKPASGFSLPKAAIIIDDIGYDPLIVKLFLELDIDITFSIFPFCPFRESIIKEIQTKGMEIMLHLPMEPVEYPDVDPGKFALLASMSPKQLIETLEYNLEQIKNIKGVNNHMGSRITAMPTQMYLILSRVKQKNLFFIDSVTSSDSVCKSSARILQLPFAARDIFLDHIQKPEIIRRQIRRLTQIAEAYGEALGIGHPHKITYEILKQELPLLKKKVQIVPASRIIHTIG